MIQLIVQGQELDLFKEEVFAISKAVSKVGEFDLRFGDVSIAFNVPLTAKNNAIFRYISNLNNDNIGAFKRFEGEIREDDALLSAGYYQVLSANSDSKQIKIRFYGGNSDWFDLIRDRFINVEYPKEIGNPNSTTYSLQDLNHQFEESVIVDSRTKTDGYFYFLADNGSKSETNSNIFVENDFQVGVYEHTILSKIFQSVGIKTEGNLFDDPLLYQTIVTAGTDLNEFQSLNTSKRFNNTFNETINGNNESFAPISFTRNNVDPQWNGTQFISGYNTGNFTFSGRIVTNESPTFWNSVSAVISINFKLNGGIVSSTTISPDASLSTDLSLTFDEFSYTYPSVSIGDILEIEYQANTSSVFFIPEVQVNGRYLYLDSFLRYDIEDAIIPYDINNALPKIKQSDFVKDIMFRLGVVSTYDSKKRVLKLNKFQNVDNNRRNAIDLTDKIDLSKDIEVDFTKIVQNYFKTSFTRYKPDENDTQLRLFKFVAKLGLGDGQINIDNDNLTDEGDVFESQYAATKDVFSFPLSGNSFNFYVPYIPFKNAQLEDQDVQPRVLIAVPNLPVAAFSPTFAGISVNSNIYTSIGYAYFAKQRVTGEGVLNDALDRRTFTLSFQNYELNTSYFGDALLDRNYDLYRRILNNPIYLPIYLNLDNLDVQNYDPLTPVYLDFKLDSGYYYWEEISQYKGDGTTTKVGLVKI